MSDGLNPGINPVVSVPEGEKYTSLMAQHLKDTRPWVLFIAIIMVVGASFMVLGGIAIIAGSACLGMTAAGRSLSLGPNSALGAMGPVLGFFYIALSGVYIPFIVFLFRYASSIKNLLSSGKTECMESALLHQKSYWKYAGILAIIMMAIAVIAVIIAIIVGIAVAFSGTR
jgi:cell division protein FtsX